MTTLSQLLANQQNALLSTGPRTEAGKATASRNNLTLGLYTKTDYVKPEERDLYTGFCDTMRAELNPACLLEESLVSEITASSWRLRHCDAADAGLTDFDDATDKLRRSIERARSRSTSVLHRGINQLRRLQSGRPQPLALPPPAILSAADLDLLTKPDAAFLEDLDAVLSERMRPGIIPARRPSETDAAGRLGSNCKPPAAPAPELASNCPPTPDLNLDFLDKPDDEFREDLDALLTQLSELASNCKPAPQTPRSAPCPCKSGEKFKRCCGKNAPPVLNRAA
jgi:hypothetical protein